MIILIILISALISIQLVNIAYHIYVSKQISQRSTPFIKENPQAKYKVLVVGDSTAVGTGATSPEDSLAGRFYHDFPKVSITNLGKNGRKSHDLINELSNLSEKDYDLVIIQIGGNDILQLVKLDDFSSNLSTVLDESKKVAKNSVLITTGNVGLAPIFPWPINNFYTQRTIKFRQKILQITKEKQIAYVDLFQDRENDPFVKDPERYHARDMLHPSSEGYEIWYQKLLETIKNNHIPLPS